MGNLTNEDVWKAVKCWYENGNLKENMENLLGPNLWQAYQKAEKENDLKNFFSGRACPEINFGSIVHGLMNYGDSRHRIGFKVEKVMPDERSDEYKEYRERLKKFPGEAIFGGFGNPDAKFHVVFKIGDKKQLNNMKKKIEFFVDTNDKSSSKENRQANYLLAKRITQAWQKAGLPACEQFSYLDKNEKQEILAIEKDPEKLKEFWRSVQL